VHPILTQYLFPPDEIMESSANAAAALGEAAKLSLSMSILSHSAFQSCHG
jgi:hypothetical protein